MPQDRSSRPGSPGIGDPYFPSDGNGGYDVAHYDLEVTYDPATDELDRRRDDHGEGHPEPVGLQPRLRRARPPLGDGQRRRRARRSATASELTVNPKRACRTARPSRSSRTTTACPETLEDFGLSGFIHTDDGAIVIGEPHVAATWFPANDHPRDKASFTLRHHRPGGGRGDLQRRPHGPEDAATAGRPGPGTRGEPMATYLAFMAIGQFDITRLPAGRHQVLGRDRSRPAGG